MNILAKRLKLRQLLGLIVFGCILNGYFYFIQHKIGANYFNTSRFRLIKRIADEDFNATADSWDYNRRINYGAKELIEFHEKFDTLPDYYILDREKRPKHRNNNCTRYPRFTDLQFTNQFWQTLETGGGIIQLLSAFFDNRTQPVVRLVSLINQNNFTGAVVCYLWYDNFEQPIISETVKVDRVLMQADALGLQPVTPTLLPRPKITHRNGLYLTYLITCPIPSEFAHIVPDSISLVKRKCGLPTTNLKVLNERPSDGMKKDFAVCVKAIDFGFMDNAINLVEWLELSNILGADLITMYIYRATDDFITAARYYENSGLMKVFNMSVPGQLMPFPMYTYKNEKYRPAQNLQLAAYQDCFYRNFQKYKYIAIVDIDEILLPVHGYTWADMFKEIDAIKDHNEPYAEYVIRQMRFFTDWNRDETVAENFPSYTPMLSHVTRVGVSHEQIGPKGFRDTRYTVSVHHHWPVSCFGPCKYFYVPLNISQMNHYREKHGEEAEEEVFEDTLVWKYKDELTMRTTKTLLDIGWIEKEF